MYIDDLLGKTLIEIKGLKPESGEVYFKCSDGTEYKMYHYQDCCEWVSINEVVGDINDLLHSPILQAEEKTNHNDTFGKFSDYESFTWTFYTLATKNGYVDIKWLGTSNGYYSESVTFYKVG